MTVLTEGRRTPLESPAEKLLGGRWVRRAVRNGLIAAAVVFGFVELVGEPLLRWEYHYRGRYSERVIADARYVGLSGSLEAHADEYAAGCPLVLFVKPDPPLWRRAVDWASAPTHQHP